MYELAARGYLCLLPKMPENLAILSINAADKLTHNHKDETSLVEDIDWYLAGHSLGGVAASSFLDDTLNKQKDDAFPYKGIILCASYPTIDLSDDDIRLLSIYGSDDKVLNLKNYEKSKEKWPKDSEEYVIKGGIHSYFGNYGIQNGDGTPSITNEEQIIEAADAINSWIKEDQQ